MAHGRSRSTVVVLLVMAVGLALGAFGVAGARQVVADSRFRPVKVPTASPTPSEVAQALASLTSAPTLNPSAPSTDGVTASGVRAALTSLLAAPTLAGAAADVTDVSGSPLFSANLGAAVAPASTLKLLTAAALLTVRAPTDTITTTVVTGATPGQVVLVGGGDPTLSAAPKDAATTYDGAARIGSLADSVKAALHGQAVTSVVVDDSLFTGPDVAPGWSAADIPSDFATRITAAMVDGGRDTPDAGVRSAQPALAAGRALAAALGLRDGSGVTLGKAPAQATKLAAVSSAPLGRIVEDMLTQSDNVLAEALGRQVALATGQPASFAGTARAIASVLQGVGIATGNGTVDASGLSTRDHIPARALADVLLRALDPGHPELRSIVSGMPVAGWSGTLADRYTGPQQAARGEVRAKTGTLDGVSALAGIVTDRDGQTLVLVLVANRVPLDGVDAARTALDAVAATLAACGCK